MQIIHIAPHGNDSNCGTKDSPLATPEAALIRLRESAGQERKMLVAPGTYYNVALSFEASDAGLAIEAAGDEKPVFCGGRVLQGWLPDDDGLWACDVPGVRAGDWDFRSLIVNGRFADRARYPEEGVLTHRNVFDVRWLSSSEGGWERKPTDAECTELLYQEGDLGKWVVARNAEVQIFHQWDDSLVGVKAIDEDTCKLILSSPSGYPAGAFYHNGGNPKAREYVLWNIREGMTRPGQWYLDREREKVVYWPLPDEVPDSLCIIAPVSHSIVRMAPLAGTCIENISIRGLELLAATTPLVAAGFGASKMPGAIGIIGDVRDITLDNLHVHHVSGHGLFAAADEEKRVPQGIRILRSRFEYCGAGGMRVNAAERSVAQDNVVCHIGLVYASAIALTLQGRYNRIAHNEVSHCPYSAIVAGGTGNRVEYNYIHDYMEFLADGAAIYSYKFVDGLYRGNVAVGRGSVDGYLRHAYYLDELSENSVVEQNLAINTSWPCHNHMAKHCTIRDNIFIDDGESRLSFPRSHDYIFERNIISAGGKIELRVMEDSLTAFQHNILYSRIGECIRLSHGEDGYSRAGTAPLVAEQGNRLDDPAVSVADGFKVTTTKRALFEELGLEEGLDFSRAGVRAKMP